MSPLLYPKRVSKVTFGRLPIQSLKHHPLALVVLLLLLHRSGQALPHHRRPQLLPINSLHRRYECCYECRAPAKQASQKFGDVDTTSAKGMYSSIRHGTANKSAVPPPVAAPIPPAFAAPKNNFAPPPVRRVSSTTSTAEPVRATPPPPPPPPPRAVEPEPEEPGEWAEALYEYASEVRAYMLRLVSSMCSSLCLRILVTCNYKKARKCMWLRRHLTTGMNLLLSSLCRHSRHSHAGGLRYTKGNVVLCRLPMSNCSECTTRTRIVLLGV